MKKLSIAIGSLFVIVALFASTSTVSAQTVSNIQLAKKHTVTTHVAVKHKKKKPAARVSTSLGLNLTCKDGTVSHAQHREGACSHHGGIAQ